MTAALLHFKTKFIYFSQKQKFYEIITLIRAAEIRKIHYTKNFLEQKIIPTILVIL